jgi:hypothetical protein
MVAVVGGCVAVNRESGGGGEGFQPAVNIPVDDGAGAERCDRF